MLGSTEVGIFSTTTIFTVELFLSEVINYDNIRCFNLWQNDLAKALSPWTGLKNNNNNKAII